MAHSYQAAKSFRASTPVQDAHCRLIEQTGSENYISAVLRIGISRCTTPGALILVSWPGTPRTGRRAPRTPVAARASACFSGPVGHGRRKRRSDGAILSKSTKGTLVFV